MLKRKGRWRAWLGRRGELWYYTDDDHGTKHRVTPAVLSSLIALLSIGVSGYLGYSSMAISRGMLTANRRTYLSQHPPKIVVRKSEFRKVDDQPVLTLDIENRGESIANDISISGSEGFAIATFENIVPPVELSLKIPALGPNATQSQDVGLIKEPVSFEKLDFWILIDYENEVGDRQRPTVFCASIEKHGKITETCKKP